MKSKRSSKHSRGNGSNRSSLSKTLNRRATFEPLESRQLLAVTLPVIGTQLVQAGAPLNLALDSTGTTNQVNYTVSINNTVAGTPNLSYTIPTGNTFLKLQVDDATDNIHGSLVFKLFGDVASHAVQTITNLVNQGYYNGLDFHRVLENFMIQGGGFFPNGTQRDPTAAPYNVTPYANEIDANYKFTGSGILALANQGIDRPNSNTSQFYITSGPGRFMDGNYTIFGMLVEGEDIRQALAKVAVKNNGQGEISAPNNSIIITSASIVTNVTDAVLRLSATSGSTGTSVVTVTAKDSVTLETATRSFTVYVQPDVGTGNTAPTLAAHAPALGNTAMVTPITIGVSSFINNGSGTTTVTDTNTGTPLGGIAITSLTGLGTWKYSLDGANFVTITTSKLSATSALLLSKNAKLLYTPDGTHAETPKITYLAWDMTFGNEGQLVLAQNNPNYGIAAFSTTSDIATLNVYINTAPVLTPIAVGLADGPSMGSTTSGSSKDINISSFINNGTGTTDIRDTDPGALIGGIAITDITGNGTWAYSLDGTNFTTLSNTSPANALLLPKNAKLRYTPSGTITETATIYYRAWDTTTGNAGGRADFSLTSSYGGTTAFSSAKDSATLTVNDAPVLISHSPTMGQTDENTPFSIAINQTFINDPNNIAGTTKITDANSDAKLGGIAIVEITGSGTWEYAPYIGSSFQPIGSVSMTSALLLSKTPSQLRYVPDGKNNEQPTIKYYAWDNTFSFNGQRVDLTQFSPFGGTTAFSTLSDTATLIVTAVNDAPVITQANPSLGSTDPSTAKTVALSDFISINHVAGKTSIDDVDTGAVKGGIAVTAVTGLGTWAYSIDNGVNFMPIEKTLTNATALLLPSTAKLRYTPDALDSGLVTITYCAWDTTGSGTAGGRANLSLTDATGGTTAFSTATDKASLLVNAAPVLTPAPTPHSLGTTNEDTTQTFNLTDFINNGTETTKIVDTNAGGIALITLTGNGTWSYSLPGPTNFISIDKTTVNNAAVLLLPKDAKLRYTPDGNNGEATPASITYCAWDESSGAAGGRFNISQPNSTGGSTAFSDATDSVKLTVTSLNDAPVIATPASPLLGIITKDSPKTIPLADFIKQQGTGATIISDVDNGAVIGGIALVGVTGNGTWAYSIDGGTNFTSIDKATLTTSAALLLDKNAILRYTPNSVANSETATITYRAWDTTNGIASGGMIDLTQFTPFGGATAFSADPDTASLVVNNAPVLTAAAPSLESIVNSSTKTFTLTEIINGSAGTTNITDPDGNDVKGGIALVGITGSGTWAYSVNGTDFTNITSVNPTSALLLPKDAKLRYTPNGSSGEIAKITYIAWDTTTGVAGGRADTSSSGGATAFSTDSDTASLTVRAQPTDITLALTNGKLPDNTPIGSTVGSLSTVALPDGGTFTYSLVSGTGSDDNAAFTINGNNLVTAATFNAGLKGTYKIRVRTADQLGLTFEKALTITLTDVTAPTVTINQQIGQPDPTHAGQIIFKVVFSEPVTDFIAADVVLSGTAPGASVQYVNGSGATYEVKVTGMTASGTVAATIPAGKAHDAAGNANLASTSDDNVVTYQKNWIVYGGTGKDDTFVFSPGATPGTWQVLVNATFYAIPAGTQGVILDGLGGNDSVKIVGTSANENFETWPNHGIFKSGDFEMDANNFESFTLDGAGGNDSAIVHGRDSAPDTFVTGPGWVTMNGSTMPISNVENLTVVANPGQASTAYMFVAAGTAGKNSLAISPSSATLNMPGHVNIVQNFANVQVYTILGGGDTATFTDSSGDDIFVASPIGAQMFAKKGGSDISAWGFTHVNGNSSSENDLAYFFTLPGSRDTFVMAPGSATYTGESFENKANGFKNVQAYADPATDSTATLIGTSGNDNIAMSPLGMQLYAAGGYDLSVWSFRNVVCQGNGGHDMGNFFGATSGSTTLAADSQSVTMTINGNSKTASGFEQIKAYGNSSSDKATFDNAGIIDSGDTTGHADRQLNGSPYNHSLLLNNFDELWTTAKPSVTTPVKHDAIDQVMSTYWP